MPGLVFDWNDSGFNNVPTVPNCHSLTGAGAVNHDNILFTFPKGMAIGTWSRNMTANLPWYEIRIYVLDSLMLSA
jgi:hypothetical protein